MAGSAALIVRPARHEPDRSHSARLPDAGVDDPPCHARDCHITALAGAFLAVAAAAGAPPLLAAALFASFSNLCGATTNYSTGPVVIYFGLGYVPAGRWFAVGLAIALFHLAIWIGVGMAWWKLLGWW